MIEEQIVILNVLKYYDKKTNEPKLRIGYIFSDESKFQDKPMFKGYTEQSLFYDGHDIFDKIPKDFLYTPLKAYFEEKPSLINPLKKYYVLNSIINKKNEKLVI